MSVIAIHRHYLQANIHSDKIKLDSSPVKDPFIAINQAVQQPSTGNQMEAPVEKFGEAGDL